MCMVVLLAPPPYSKTSGWVLSVGQELVKRVLASTPDGDLQSLQISLMLLTLRPASANKSGNPPASLMAKPAIRISPLAAVIISRTTCAVCLAEMADAPGNDTTRLASTRRG